MLDAEVLERAHDGAKRAGLNGKTERAKRKQAATAESAPKGEPHFTDMGNAQRFVRDHRENVRYCHPWKKWLVWDDRRWLIDDTGAILRLAKATIRKLYDDAAAKLAALRDATDLDDEQKEAIAKAIKAILTHAHKSEDARALGRMLDLARSEPGIPVLPADLDRDPWLLNCENGTINLRTGKLHPHRREDLLTKLCPTAYDPDAKCPRFAGTVDAIFDKDEDLVESLLHAATQPG